MTLLWQLKAVGIVCFQPAVPETQMFEERFDWTFVFFSHIPYNFNPTCIWYFQMFVTLLVCLLSFPEPSRSGWTATFWAGNWFVLWIDYHSCYHLICCTFIKIQKLPISFQFFSLCGSTFTFLLVLQTESFRTVKGLPNEEVNFRQRKNPPEKKKVFWQIYLADGKSSLCCITSVKEEYKEFET